MQSYLAQRTNSIYSQRMSSVYVSYIPYVSYMFLKMLEIT